MSLITKRVTFASKTLDLEMFNIRMFLNGILSSRPPAAMYPYPPAPPYPPYMPPPRPPMPQQPMPGVQPPPSYRQAMQQPRPNLGPRLQMPPSTRTSMNQRPPLPSRPQPVATRQRVPPQRLRPGTSIREQRPHKIPMPQNGQFMTNSHGQKVLVKRPSDQMHGSHQPKRKRMDILMPNKNDDADCQLISVQPKNSGLPQIQNVQVGSISRSFTHSTNSQNVLIIF